MKFSYTAYHTPPRAAARSRTMSSSNSSRSLSLSPTTLSSQSHRIANIHPVFKYSFFICVSISVYHALANNLHLSSINIISKTNGSSSKGHRYSTGGTTTGDGYNNIMSGLKTTKTMESNGGTRSSSVGVTFDDDNETYTDQDKDDSTDDASDEHSNNTEIDIDEEGDHEDNEEDDTSVSNSNSNSNSASFYDEIPTELTNIETNDDDDDDYDDDELEGDKPTNTNNTNTTSSKCEFMEPYDSAPIPLVLMALGRSGSSVTWDTLSTMLGSTTKAYEITGGNRTKATMFFDVLYDRAQLKYESSLYNGNRNDTTTATSATATTADVNTDMDTATTTTTTTITIPEIPTMKHNGYQNTRIHTNWVIKKLCRIQKYNIENYMNPVITGFQWKPYRYTLNHPMGQGGLYSLSSSSSSSSSSNHPPIKVLFLKRNPLDRLISNLRHKGYQHTEEVPAHCAIDDSECIKRHVNHSKRTTLPTDKELVVNLKSGLQIDHMTQSYLDYFDIDYVSVEYEKLYNNDNEVVMKQEWMKIFDFLDRFPKKYNGNKTEYELNFSSKDVKEAFRIAPTSAKKHIDMIANYEDVKKTLERRGMDYLLH